MESEITKKELVQKLAEMPMQTLRVLITASLYRFLRYFWDVYSNDEFEDNWHIRKLCEELEVVARRVMAWKPKLYDLIINVPPGTSKTSIVMIMFPVWCWVNAYWMKFIAGSYSASLALESAEYSRDILRSQKFQSMFPELGVKQDKDTKSNFRVLKREYVSAGYVPRLRYGGNRFSTSVGGTVTGFHGHILLIDDPIDPNRSVSDKERIKANNWIDRTLSQRKVKRSIVPTIMIMQRLHEDDPTGYLLKKKKTNVKHICLPAEIKNYEKEVQPEDWKKYYKNQLLDPRRLSWSTLKEEMKNLGQYGYAGQMGQRPVPAEGGMFKIDKFTTITHIPSKANIVRIVRYWDKAGSKGTGAYTVGVKMAKLKNGKYVVMDVRRGQWSSEAREAVMKATAVGDANEVNEIGIEQEPGSGGKESAEATVRNLSGFTVYKDLPRGDKIYRADPYSVAVNNGDVMLLHGDWNEEFKKEHEYFPNSTYKDQVDAASGAFARLNKAKRAGVV